MKINSFTIWLLLVIAWNYIFPTVPPLYDVVAAIILAFLKSLIHRNNKKTQF